MGGYGSDPRTGCDPLVVGLELHIELVVVDIQIAVAASHDRFGHERLHLLRHDTDIGSAAPVISEAIDANTVVQTTEEGDVMLESDVGAPATAATTSAAATPAAATPTSYSGPGTSAPATDSAATATAAEVLPAAICIDVRPSC